MKKEFFINLIFLVLINLLIKPFYLLGIDRTIQNEVGPSEYGLYWALFNFIFLFQVINDLGLQNFTTTFISQNRAITEKYFGFLAGLKVTSSLVFLVVVAIGALAFGYNQWSLLIPLICSQIAISFVFFLRGTISGLGYYKTDSILSVLDKLMMIIICGWLLWGRHSIMFTIQLFVYVQLISILVTLIVALTLVISKVDRFLPRWNTATWKVLMKKSAPFALTFILTTLFTRMDSVMVERMLPDGAFQAGVYAAGWRLLEAGNMLAYLFVGLLLPMFAHVQKSKTETQSLYSTGLMMMWVVVVSIALMMITYHKEVMDLLYSRADDTWFGVLIYLMMSFVPMGVSYICGALLLANHRVKKLNWIYATAVLINLVLNLIWIPQEGVMGAARATLCTQTAATILVMALIFFELKIWPGRMESLKMASFTVLAGILIYGGKVYFESISWVWIFMTSGLGLIILALLLRMIPLHLLNKNKS